MRSSKSTTADYKNGAVPPRPLIRGEAHLSVVGVSRLLQMRATYVQWVPALFDRLRWVRKGAPRAYGVRVDGQVLQLLARVNGFDVRAINEVCIGRVYDRWLRGSIPGCVIDVGANCGYFTVLAGALGASELIAIEPDADNARLLRANLELNGLQARVIEGAVTADPSVTEVVLHHSADPRLHSIFDREAAAAMGLAARDATGASSKVDAVHLENVVHDALGRHGRVSLLKVDIEGPEWEVLDTLADDTLARIDLIVVESDAPAPTKFDRRIRDLGFFISTDQVYWAAQSLTDRA